MAPVVAMEWSSKQVSDWRTAKAKHVSQNQNHGGIKSGHPQLKVM